MQKNAFNIPFTPYSVEKAVDGLRVSKPLVMDDILSVFSSPSTRDYLLNPLAAGTLGTAAITPFIPFPEVRDPNTGQFDAPGYFDKLKYTLPVGVAAGFAGSATMNNALKDIRSRIMSKLSSAKTASIADDALMGAGLIGTAAGIPALLHAYAGDEDVLKTLAKVEEYALPIGAAAGVVGMPMRRGVNALTSLLAKAPGIAMDVKSKISLGLKEVLQDIASAPGVRGMGDLLSDSASLVNGTAPVYGRFPAEEILEGQLPKAAALNPFALANKSSKLLSGTGAASSAAGFQKAVVPEQTGVFNKIMNWFKGPQSLNQAPAVKRKGLIGQTQNNA